MNMEQRLRGTIAQGFTAMALLLLMMIATDLVERAIVGDFSRFAVDPGVSGLWLLVILSAINVGGQLMARLVNSRPARWALFGVAIAYTLFFVGHQASHLLAGDRFDLHFVLDLTHHAAGVIASIAALRLARLP